MRVHRLIEHVPVGSNRLQALFLSDDLALTASDFELPVTRDIAEVLGKMPGATLLARDLDHDLGGLAHDPLELGPRLGRRQHGIAPPLPLPPDRIRSVPPRRLRLPPVGGRQASIRLRSEEHTSELQSLMRISYAVFC